MKHEKILLIHYVLNRLLNSVGITYGWTSQRCYLIKQGLVKYILIYQTVLYNCHNVEDWKPTPVIYEGATWFHPRSKFPHQSQHFHKPVPESKLYSVEVWCDQNGVNWARLELRHTFLFALWLVTPHKEVVATLLWP